jgi:hypothetical protein
LDASQHLDITDVQMSLLDMAVDDCWGLPEFYPGIIGAGWDEHVHPEAVDLFRAAAIALLQEGLIRLHHGEQCNGHRSEGSEYDIAPKDLADMDPSAWEPEAEPRLYLCETPDTRDAYDRMYAETARRRTREGG